MSNRARLLISVLFIAGMILCVGLTRFYFDVTKNTGDSDTKDRVASVVETYGDMRVFVSQNGAYGVLNADDAIVIEPEWLEILDVTPELVLVSQKINDTVLIGGIDYEENVVLPFVFRKMESYGAYHLGTVDEDGSCLLYREDYTPVFSRSFDNAYYGDELLQMELSGCEFCYFLAGSGPRLQCARMQCDVLGGKLQWNIANRKLLDELSEDDLLRLNECVGTYMDMLEQSDFSDLPDITGSDYIGRLTKPGSFLGMTFEEIGHFSFEDAKKEDTYDFSFAASYHTEETEEQAAVNGTVQLHLYFRRNTENKLILTSADLNFQNPEPTPQPDEE